MSCWSRWVRQPGPRRLGARARILNHVAYQVTDLAAAAAHLQKEGCARTGDPKPAIAYGGCRIQFFVTPMRFIVELIEAPDHRHEFAPEIFTASADEADGRS